MHASEAMAIARAWVAETARDAAIRGALWHGSVLDLDPDAPLPAGSDIDIVLVADDPVAVPVAGKIERDGVLLDISAIASADVTDPARILADPPLAPTFRNPEILHDPTGALAAVQREVAAHFAERAWVQRRVDATVEKIRRNLGSAASARPWPERVMAWLFGTGITTHVVLVAALRNPTVRKRYLAARELLAEHDRLDDYAWLLELLGAGHLTAAQVGAHLDALEPAFDRAGEVTRTPLPYANDLKPSSRRVAIGGSRELIAGGNHREAVFWVVATWTRVMTVFHHDAPELEERFAPAFAAMLADIGIRKHDDLPRRSVEVEAGLPRLTALADDIMAATPEITG